MFAKLLDGRLVRSPQMLPGDGVNIYNPPAEMLLEAGWKPVTFTPVPDAPSGYYYEGHWEETQQDIIQTWVLVEEPDDVEPDEALEILFGGTE